MKKWKKLLLPAMCAFMLQTPVIANADSNGNTASVTEDSAVTTTPRTETPTVTPSIAKWN